jgi:hypothetical protein
MFDYLLNLPLMRLCFNATKFGGGLDWSIELAAAKGLPSIEYCFAPFKTSGKGAQEVKGKEKAYLEKIADLSRQENVEFACLALDYVHHPGDKASLRSFSAMLSKLVEVAGLLFCKRLSFSIAPGLDESWKEKFECEYATLSPIFQSREIKPLLRLATPAEFRGVSLKRWRAMEPQDWRDLVSGCPGLSLSFSPADCLWLGIDYLQILSGVTAAIEHVEAHDIEINRPLLKDSGMFGPLWWRYRQIGKGQVDWGQFIEALKLYDYTGSFSIQLDDEFLDGDEMALSAALDDGIQRIAPLIKE